MAYTRTFNVNSSTYTAVTVQTVCRKVTVYEDAQAGTTDYYLSGAGGDSDRVQKPAGSKKEFESTRPLQPNEILGYIKTVSGSVSFAQEEEA